MGKASVKVEGGKMVTVRVDRAGVSVTGDFFIEPAEAREDIEDVLEELGAGTSGDEIAEAVLQVDAEFIGFSAEHVVEAFQKAVDGDEE